MPRLCGTDSKYLGLKPQEALACFIGVIDLVGRECDGNASPASGDADVVGDLDLFISDQNGNTFFFRNTASVGAASSAITTPIDSLFRINSTAVVGYTVPVFADLPRLQCGSLLLQARW